MNADTNNIAPRVGFAWRFKPGTILRGGYGISYNAGSYSSIARQLVGQPPFAVTSTAVGDRHPGADHHRPARHRAAGRDDQQLRRRARLRARRGADVERRPLARPAPGLERRRAATPTRAAPASTSCARPTAARTACASTASSRSSGSRPKDPRCCTPATFRLRRRPVKGIGGGATYTLARRATTPRRSAAAAPSSRRTIGTSTRSGGSRASIGGTSCRATSASSCRSARTGRG